MRHAYLNKKEIYSALSSASITTKESRELLKTLEGCKKVAMRLTEKNSRGRTISNEIEFH